MTLPRRATVYVALPSASPHPVFAKPDASVISLGPEQRYQISKRDIRQRLAGYDGRRSAGVAARLQEVRHPFRRRRTVPRDTRTYAVE